MLRNPFDQFDRKVRLQTTKHTGPLLRRDRWKILQQFGVMLYVSVERAYERSKNITYRPCVGKPHSYLTYFK
jgi:hypothetical protein